MINQPDFIIYAQHGWADNGEEINKLAQTLATDKSLVIAPDLGWWKTWIRIEPLIEELEKIVLNTIKEHPNLSMRIIGHSLGGLIWLELLQRHPEWFANIHSLVLVASPVGGSDLARIIDPLDIGIGMAKDLSKNRRSLAESIAKVIPSLTIAGNIDDGSDGVITIESTKFNYAKFVCLPGISHPELKNHRILVDIIEEFWQKPVITTLSEPNFSSILIEHLRAVSGITDAHYRDFKYAKPYIEFEEGITIKTWTNPVGVNHVFIANSRDKCIYSGFVGWMHNEDLYNALERIKQKYAYKLKNIS
jgi:hypothetical protein